MKYTVSLSKQIELTTSIEVEASSREEAGQLAEEKAEGLFEDEWDQDDFGGYVTVEDIEEDDEEEDEEDGDEEDDKEDKA